MINPKYMTVSAGVGFFLSFFISLVSRNGFAHSLLMAVIFAAVFAALAAGICVLYGKFLAEGSAPSTSIETPKAQATGSLVNITIDEDNLPDDAYAPKFTVGRNRKALGLETPAEKAPYVPRASAAPAAPASARPAEAASVPAGGIASAQAPKAAPASQAAAPAAGGGDAAPFKPMDLSSVTSAKAAVASVVPPSSPETLDDLPDIGDFSPAEAPSGGEDIINDSEFAAVGSGPAVKMPSGGGVEQNAALMAQAIRTSLLKDN